MLAHITIHDGETLGEFCTRNRVTRCHVFALNPQLQPVPMDGGGYTARLRTGDTLQVMIGALAIPAPVRQAKEARTPLQRLHTGPRLALGSGAQDTAATEDVGPDPRLASEPPEFDNPHFIPFSETTYNFIKGCLAQNGIPDEGGCGTLVKRSDGDHLLWPNGRDDKIAPEEATKLRTLLPYVKACIEAGGMVNEQMGAGGEFPCMKVGRLKDKKGVEYLGVFSDQFIDIPPPKAAGDESKNPDDWSTGKKIAAGGVVVGLGLLVWKFLF